MSPQSPGLPASSRTLTIRASKLFPATKDPIWFSKPHTDAPPAVARYSSVDIGSGLLANPDVAAGSEGTVVRCWKEHTFDAMLAFWMALRIEMLYPPETSVPSPTLTRESVRIHHAV